MLATVRSATLLGVDGHAVTVEVHVSVGLPSFTVVGLPDTSCREARDRVRAAILSSGLAWPKQRITVNLAPSGLRKAGSGLDLAIAMAVLVASEVARCGRRSGAWRSWASWASTAPIRPVPGAVPLVDALPGEIAVVPVASAVEALARRSPSGAAGGQPGRADRRAATRTLRGPTMRRPAEPVALPSPPDLADVRGQPFARRGPRGRRGRRAPLSARRATRRGQDACWRSACPVCCPISSTPRRCRPLGSIRPPGWRCRRAGSCAGPRFALLTTGPVSCRWLAVAATRFGPAR